METGGYLTSISAGVFYLIASFRLLRLSLRTHERPERLLGLYFLLCGFYYVVYNVPSLFGFDAWPSAALWVVEWCYVLGVIPFLYFIREVFRPGEIWARGLVTICVVLMLTGTGVASFEDHSNFTLRTPWFLMQWVGYTAPCAWVIYEAGLHHWDARKRVEIGLCEPLTANRFLLMALFGVFQCLACLAFLIYSADLESSATASQLSDALVGGTEFASAAILWLAFFPPSFYARWIRRRAVIRPTAMAG